MEFFATGKSFRLRSHLDKYLFAGSDKISVRQSRNVNSERSIWKVDYVDHKNNVVIVKSCYGRFLSVSKDPFLLGMTGKKIVQKAPENSCAWQVAWEPIRDGFQVKLKTFNGNFLRANGCTFPWRNSVTHDIPFACTTQKWTLWCVEPMYEIFSPEYGSPSLSDASFRSCYSDWEIMSPPSVGLIKAGGIVDQAGSSDSSTLFSDKSSDDSFESTPKKIEGRTIFYRIADESGYVHEETTDSYFTIFNGKEVDELTRKLEEETEMIGISVCFRSPLNGQLLPLRLQLPPYCSTMHVVVVPSSSKLAKDISEKRQENYDTYGEDYGFTSAI